MLPTNVGNIKCFTQSNMNVVLHRSRHVKYDLQIAIIF